MYESNSFKGDTEDVRMSHETRNKSGIDSFPS
jgi:hypothetical protein